MRVISTLIFYTAGLLAVLALAALRYEQSSVGLSEAYVWAETVLYNVFRLMQQLHAQTALFLAAVIAIYLVRSSNAQSAPFWTFVFTIPAVAMLAMTVIMLPGTVIPQEQAGAGWQLYVPQGPVFQNLIYWLNTLKPYQALGVYGATIIGCALLLPRTKGERWIAYGIIAFTLFALGSAANLVTPELVTQTVNYAIFPTLALLAFVSFQLSDGERPGLIYLFAGSATVIGAMIMVSVVGAMSANTDFSYIQTARLHGALYTLPAFGLFAARDMRTDGQATRITLYVHAGALALTSTLIVWEMMQLGRANMLISYADYPAVFGPGQLRLTGAAILYGLVILWGLRLTRHRRAG